MFVDAGLRAFAVHVHLVFRSGLLQTIEHMLSLCFKFLFAVRARLAFQHDQIGNDVGGHAAFDLSDVGRRLVIDASELHHRQAFRRDLDR